MTCVYPWCGTYFTFKWPVAVWDCVCWQSSTTKCSLKKLFLSWSVTNVGAHVCLYIATTKCTLQTSYFYGRSPVLVRLYSLTTIESHWCWTHSTYTRRLSGWTNADYNFIICTVLRHFGCGSISLDYHCSSKLQQPTLQLNDLHLCWCAYVLVDCRDK